MRRWIAAALSLVALPGCFSIAAAAAGGDARTMRAAGELDGAMIGAIAEGVARAAESSAARDDDALHASAPPDGDRYVCALAGGETQAVRAHSVEGARAVCLMTNDVDQRGAWCDCGLAR